jgi:hypothetical protein
MSLQRASEAQRPKATYSVTFKCPHGPQDLRQECLLKQSQPTAEGTRVRATTTKWGCKAQFVMRHLEDAYTDKYGSKLCGIYYKIVDHGIHPDSTGSQVNTLVLSKLPCAVSLPINVLTLIDPFTGI